MLASARRWRSYGRRLTAGVLIAGTAIAGIGVAAMTPSSLSIVVSSYPPERRGLPIGVWGASTAFGVAVTGAVFNSLQLSQTQSLAADRGIQVSAQQAQDLDGLLAGAPGARSTLAEFPHRTQEALEHVVREAFMHALGGAFRVGGFVALGGLLLALALIRRRPPADELEARQGAGAPGGAPSSDPATPPA